MTTYQQIYSRDSGLKIITPMINKIHNSGFWPKDFLHVTKEKSRKEMQRQQNN
jgi:hypothetical protein